MCHCRLRGAELRGVPFRHLQGRFLPALGASVPAPPAGACSDSGRGAGLTSARLARLRWSCRAPLCSPVPFSARSLLVRQPRSGHRALAVLALSEAGMEPGQMQCEKDLESWMYMPGEWGGQGHREEGGGRGRGRGESPRARAVKGPEEPRPGCARAGEALLPPGPVVPHRRRGRRSARANVCVCGGARNSS